MKLRYLLFAGLIILLTAGLVACGGAEESGSTAQDDSSADETSGDEEVTLHLAALESAYDDEMWENIIENYEAANENVAIELTSEKNLEEVIRPQMQAGDYPDVFLLATDREEALTETLIKEDGLENISDVLDMTVPGEDVAVKDKMLEGFSDTLATNPYGDGEMYMAPMFYSPSGMFYNAGLLEEKGWEVPTTWDEMWELGDESVEEELSLFTYPIAEYFDTFLGSMFYASGGPDFFNSVMTYEEGIWETAEAERVLQTVEQLADYTHPNTVANANPNDFTRNQQLILDNEALFMPNGTWVVEEMADAPRADDFEWGMTSVPAFEDGQGDRYAFTFFEQMWIPEQAENKEAAKEFIAYMYSDEAADIFLEAGAVQPIEGMTDKLEGQKQEFYSIYEEDVLPAMGTFASTEPVPGANMGDALYGSVDSVVNGNMSVQEWQADIQEVSDKLRPQMK
ncbi:carbohydrate ABC transporter substrate-binding protein [Virgibacillus sp. NKC19-3]|uniref:carbohydrate ABC transporter substrate-binding protein n=1 Tax=Virgibacillus saliphilus TaxID=2831674 RepID=UPI001C9B10E3|nr:carbohydrate ABC transporter substrate-binding protein [Virgibacillus sp. NKC19-3]MBY7142850.1 carbohydrate ABC transporter substrate-binding protein [Virgibacillus sp. NKC19-3]